MCLHSDDAACFTGMPLRTPLKIISNTTHGVRRVSRQWWMCAAWPAAVRILAGALGCLPKRSGPSKATPAQKCCPSRLQTLSGQQAAQSRLRGGCAQIMAAATNTGSALALHCSPRRACSLHRCRLRPEPSLSCGTTTARRRPPSRRST